MASYLYKVECDSFCCSSCSVLKELRHLTMVRSKASSMVRTFFHLVLGWFLLITQSHQNGCFVGEGTKIVCKLDQELKDSWSVPKLKYSCNPQPKLKIDTLEDLKKNVLDISAAKLGCEAISVTFFGLENLTISPDLVYPPEPFVTVQSRTFVSYTIIGANYPDHISLDTCIVNPLDLTKTETNIPNEYATEVAKKNKLSALMQLGFVIVKSIHFEDWHLLFDKVSITAPTETLI
ncbi:unnamed protein product [Albugo candida]|uniref:Uncharacterized protein n=1 Tax=Albugo candida TaxID=65357 RepID=A0A024FTA2_9STRA|nr:unnamed protein product [Albugo candida]|eukprot:CCI10323.1 unnamed protein product [Albugo candida]